MPPAGAALWCWAMRQYRGFRLIDPIKAWALMETFDTREVGLEFGLELLGKKKKKQSKGPKKVLS